MMCQSHGSQASRAGAERDFVVVDSPDWVNIVPVTPAEPQPELSERIEIRLHPLDTRVMPLKTRTVPSGETTGRTEPNTTLSGQLSGEPRLSPIRHRGVDKSVDMPVHPL
jgi:hypothetical protein